MKQRIILFAAVLIVLLVCPSYHAYGQQRIDSLRRLVVVAKHDTSRVQAMTELSLAYRQISELDSAYEYAKQAIALSKKATYPRGEARATYYIGICFATRSDYHKADSCYQLASKIFSDVGDARGTSSILVALGALKQLQGEHDAALQIFMEALKIKREIRDSASMPAALTNIGNVYNSLNRPREALVYFTEAFTIHKKNGDVTRYCDDWTNMANMHRMLGNVDTALVLIRSAIHLADSLGFIGTLPYCYGIIGTIYLSREKLDSAIVFFQKAYDYAVQAEDKYMVANHSINLGEIYAELGKNDLAESWLNKGLQVSREIDAKEHIRDAHKRLSDFYKSRNNYENAYLHYTLYIAYRDSVLDVEKQKSILRSELKSQHEKEAAVKQAEQEKIDALAAEEKKRQRLTITLVSIALILVVVFAAFLYNRFIVTRKQAAEIELQRKQVIVQRDQVEQQKSIIEDKNKSITDSINYARRIQQALLASDNFLDKHLQEYFIYYQPKDIVSGDFYWAGTSADGRFVLLTGDCTGHGVPGAFMSLLNITLLNEIVTARGLSKPGNILDAQRDALVGALNPEGSTEVSRDGMDCTLCSYNFQTRDLQIAGANNPVWLCRNGQLVEYKTDKQPVGIHAVDPHPFSTQKVQLVPGDMVYTITDGFADQFGGPDGKKFKYSKMKELIAGISQLSCEAQHNELQLAFSHWKGGLEQLDDVLVIGIRI